MSDVPPVIWRRGSFVGLFADPYVKDSELEGGWLAPSIFDFTQALSRISSGRCQFWEQEDSPSKRADLSVLVSRLLDAASLSVDKALAKSAPQEHLQSFMDKFSVAVRSLGVHDFCIRPGGWRRRSGGHVILYVIRRQTRDLFSFTVCNTGGGTQYHPSSSASYPKGSKVRAALHIPDVPIDRLTSPAFLYMLAKLELVRKEENTPESLYEVLLPYLAGTPLRDATQEATLHGNYESLQRAGTCFFRCILTAARFILTKVCGWTQSAVKALCTAVRLTYLDLASEHLRKIAMNASRGHFAGRLNSDLSLMTVVGCGFPLSGSWDDDVSLPTALTESDVFLVRIAVRQTVAAVSKLASGGSISEARLDSVEAAVRDTLDALRLAVNAAGLSGTLFEGVERNTTAAVPRMQGVLRSALEHVYFAEHFSQQLESKGGIDELIQATSRSMDDSDSAGHSTSHYVPSLVDSDAASRQGIFPSRLNWLATDVVQECSSSDYGGKRV
jgi:hypothetical protein